MNIYDYCDAINAQIELTRYANQDGRWTAKFYRCEVKDDGVLIGEYGNGKTSDEALLNYMKKIVGKVLVFDAGENRREMLVPKNLELYK